MLAGWFLATVTFVLDLRMNDCSEMLCVETMQTLHVYGVNAVPLSLHICIHFINPNIRRGLS
jgi:hypothetical protein